jgi:hypothetical protein
MKLLLAMFCALAAAISSATGQVHLTASLDGAQEVPSVSTAARGTGSFQFNDDFTELRYTVVYQGLSGTLTAGAHFHLGRPGATGGIVKAIAPSGAPASGTIAGSWRSSDATQPLTAALVESLLTGRVYVNLHTAANPAGEIRGQVMRASALEFVVDLDGQQEVPPVAAGGGGTGVFVLSPDGTEMRYWVAYRDLSGALSAGGHVHYGALGRNGSIARAIAVSGEPASNSVKGTWKSADGTQPLTPAVVDSAVAGKLYVNFHTTASPGGEIRGQLVLAGGTAYAVEMEGSKAVPPVQTNAKGVGYVVLKGDLSEARYAVTYFGLSGPLSSAGGHFHFGLPGVNGAVARTIAAEGDPASATVAGTWKGSDASQPLTRAVAESLLTGKMYVNFHTSANPGNEIRGQVDLATGIGWTVALDGAQEVPPNAATGKGGGYLFLNAERRDASYAFTYYGLTGPLSAGGHFHTGGTGVNGPLVKAIALSGAPASSTLQDNWSSSAATQALTPALVDSLVSGKIYVNFHTTANPGGEIRGQVDVGAPSITGVEQISDLVPETFGLDQNYPNPFNPSTTITFQVGRSGRVELGVYNLLGQEVARLAEGVREPGVYSVRFDGTGLASGVYLVRFSAESGFTGMRKIMLLK